MKRRNNPVHGTWLENRHFFRPTVYECSHCGCKFDAMYEECPNCGAVMDLSYEEFYELAEELLGDD